MATRSIRITEAMITAAAKAALAASAEVYHTRPSPDAHREKSVRVVVRAALMAGLARRDTGSK